MAGYEFTNPEVTGMHTLRLGLGITSIAMEITTGIKPTRGFSARGFAQQYGYPSNSTNKKAALRWLVDHSGYVVQPGSNVEKALA